MSDLIITNKVVRTLHGDIKGHTSIRIIASVSINQELEQTTKFHIPEQDITIYELYQNQVREKVVRLYTGTKAYIVEVENKESRQGTVNQNIKYSLKKLVISRSGIYLVINSKYM